MESVKGGRYDREDVEVSGGTREKEVPDMCTRETLRGESVELEWSLLCVRPFGTD